MINIHGKKGEDWGKPYQRIGFYGWKKFVAGAHIMAFKRKKEQWEYRPGLRTPGIIESIVVDKGSIKYKLVRNDDVILYGYNQYEEDVRIV